MNFSGGHKRTGASYNIPVAGALYKAVACIHANIYLIFQQV